MRRAAAALAVALIALTPAPASATDVGASEFADLVEQAPTDPIALRELGEVTSVEGRPVDLGPVLDDATPEELEARLATLGGELEPAPPSTDARGQADEILADERYEESDPPRPLKGVTEWLAERMEPVGDAITRFVRSVLPGGMGTFWILVGLLVILITILVSAHVRTRGSRAEIAAAQRGGRHAEDPSRLERSADEAEARGDFEESLRLRFRAGIVHLAQRGALPRRSSLTSEEISKLLGSSTFERLATTFDRIAYGRQPATSDDVDEARRGWPVVVKEARA